LFQHLLPGCARQTTGNSGRPKVVGEIAASGTGCHLQCRRIAGARLGVARDKFPKRPAVYLRKAAVGHAVDFFTWRTLPRQGLSNEEAVELMIGLVRAVSRGDELKKIFFSPPPSLYDRERS
jgi:hypothetical protein